MKDAEPIEEGKKFAIEALYCTKSPNSLFSREINVPLPHESKLYEGLCKRPPLEVEEGSPKFMNQTYVVPYETFQLIYDASEKVKV